MANIAIHRDKIVQAAIRLYREKGYANTGLSEILNLSGAPKGSLYYYFPGGKEELTVAAMKTAGQVVATTLRDLAAKSDNPQAFIESYCRLLAEWMEGSRFKSGCPIATTVLETVPQSKVISIACRQIFSAWTDIVSSVFTSAGYSSTDAYQEAELVIAAIEGALLLARVKQSSDPVLRVANLFQ